ncbi:MAG: PQQ-like beta-propeller repeat protein, partial [Bacteroidales bacterium]|nr:PQQ-like beta-propeller repeat protein [Bacteroidales bacterium]
AKTGNPLYDYPELGADRVTIDDGKVYFVASYGTLYIMNLKDGRILSATECPGYGTYFFGSYPTIYDNKLYIMGGTQLHCYKI